MYVLTIVFLFSHVTLTSFHATQPACEWLAEHAREHTTGSQAVAIAHCDWHAPVALNATF